MAELQETTQPHSRVTIERAPIRRFELPDLDRHGGWLVERIARAFFKNGENDLPMGQTNSTQIAVFLKGAVYSNEFHFLYQEHSVGLAQIDFGGSLRPLPMVVERFVFVQDPQNADHIAEGADFYERFMQWGRHMGAKAVIVNEMSDIPPDVIRDKVGGPLYKRQQLFARVPER